MIGSSVAEERVSGSSSPADVSAGMTGPLPGNLVNVEASRRCKLICDVCGYYMSCADYY
jgi:hypothetical protein